MPSVTIFRRLPTGVITFFAFAFGGVLVADTARADDRTGREVPHPVRVGHPAIPEGQEKPLTLFARLGSTGHPAEYYCDVQSVFCADRQCNVVAVRLLWDELGRYQRYELAPGVQLEKDDGEPFSGEDYARLDQILRDDNSPLKSLAVVDANEQASTLVAIDAVSSATPAVYEDAVVKGAAWTCFTLWHWAHGELSEIIREITASRCTVDDLREMVERGDASRKIFALRQLTERKAYDEETRDVMLRATRGEDRAVTRAVIEYLAKAPSEIYYPCMERLFVAGSADQRISVLSHLLRSDRKPPRAFLDRFSRNFAECRSYQEVDLLLRLVERQDQAGAAVISHVLLLIDSENILIARRVYWFLRDRPLSAVERKRLESFRARHLDKL